METLFNNLPQLEDAIVYSIYFPLPTLDQISFLRETSVLILSELNQYLDGYIWQKDSFELRIAKNESDPSYPSLRGKTRFGDCIDDEWFIVFLLQQISLKYQEAIISVSDSDGEFLLIEAATQLPSWLDPSNSENRVFIYRNELHIIPLPKTPAEILNIPTGKLSIDRAVELIHNDNINTKADINVQLAAFKKLNEFPQKIKQNIHHARCHIPRGIAHVLYQSPQLIAPAVEAFYTRDPIALKACQKMENFPPSTSLTVTVKFTKTLYAQMVSQRFYPPKPFKLPASNSKKFKAAELGMKLACGFEILYTDKRYRKLASGINLETYPFNEDPEWKLFRDNLMKRNYYFGEVEGSEKYKQLDNIAKQQFLLSKRETMDNDASNTTLFEQINYLLRKPMIPDEVLTANTTEDDDSWINIDYKQLEELLNERERGYREIKKESINEQGNNEQGGSVDLTNMIDAFEKFIDFEGAGVEGAEFLDEHISDDDDDMEDDDEPVDMLNDNNVRLDPTEFLNIMRRTLGISKEEYQKLATTKIKQEQEKAAKNDKTPIVAQENQQHTQPTAPVPIEEMDDDLDMDTYMQAMDVELSASRIPESFIHSPNEAIGRKDDDKTKDDLSSKKEKKKTTNQTDMDFDEESEESYRPVDINLNLVKNLLESFKSQEGLPGPVSNIFNRLGNVLPKDEEGDKSNGNS
ncbi:SGT1 protein [Glomus cerebriforme]|uniref:SGT1 protein n=1 Tax=Glomus cerebriforme TaxID=658196 RepID=A0A397TLC1_9GLOM|nr:SGT1 protein [Glomus cerebriforme]